MTTDTWEEWELRLAANRKAGIEAETDPVRKAQRIQADAMMSVTKDVMDKTFPTKPSATLAESALHMMNTELVRQIAEHQQGG